MQKRNRDVNTVFGKDMEGTARNCESHKLKILAS